MLDAIRLAGNLVAMSRPSNKPDPQVAASVRAELARAGRNQRALAGRLHLSQPAISRRLSGVQSFTIDELVDVAAYLGVEVTLFVPQSELANAS